MPCQPDTRSRSNRQRSNVLPTNLQSARPASKKLQFTNVQLVKAESLNAAPLKRQSRNAQSSNTAPGEVLTLFATDHVMLEA